MIREYRRVVKQKTGVYANWFPTQQRQPGEVLEWGDGISRIVGRVAADMKIQSSQSSTPYKFGAGGTLEPAGQIAAGATGAARVGLRAKFNKEGGIAVHARVCRIDEVTDMGAAREEIVSKIDSGEWQTGMWFINAVWVTSTFIMIQSSSAGGILELDVDANDYFSGDLVSAYTNAHVAASTTAQLSVKEFSEITPFIDAWRITKRARPGRLRFSGITGASRCAPPNAMLELRDGLFLEKPGF